MIGMNFGSFNLQDPDAGVWVTKTNVFSATTNQIQADELADRDGSLIVRQQYKSKTFTIDGWLRSADRTTFENLMDTFKTAMGQKNQALDIEYAGGIRRYLANAVNVAIADTGLTSAPFSVELFSSDGMGWSIDQENLIDSTAISSSTDSYSAALVGSYEVAPVFRLEYSAITGGTNKTVQIINGSSLRGIRVTRTWAAGDVLEFDSLKQTLYVNSVATDFAGQFPVFTAGQTAIVNYIDDLTTRTALIRAYYTPRWL